MPRYFFHVIDGRFLVDRQGTELADLQTAKFQAVHTAGEILRDAGRSVWNGAGWQMHVTDAKNKTLLRLSFSAEQIEHAQSE